MRRRTPVVLAIVGVALAAASVTTLVLGKQQDPARLAPVDLSAPVGLSWQDLHQWCVDRQAAGTAGLSYAGKTWLKGCADATSPTDVPTSPTTAPTTAPSSAPPTSGPTTPPATKPPTTTPATPSGWPDATNTGVPAGTALTAYAGPCTLNSPVTINAADIRCAQLVVNATVTITRSRITSTGPQGLAAVDVNGSLTISDSEVVAQVNSSGVDGDNITATRLNIHGGNRGMWCSHCTVQDSWIHGGRVTGDIHASALRGDQYSTYIHNSLVCDGGGDNCSADLTGYPDYEPTMHWTITGNYFGSPAGSYFCSYGGATAGKPYSSDPSNATYIQFRDNVFARGPQGTCAAPAGGGGTPIADFDKNKVGWVWSNNRYADGVLIGA